MIKLLFLLQLIILKTVQVELQVDQYKDNLVKFISDAPIESFEGITSNIDGYIYFEDNVFSNNSELYFEVDLRTIDTGIGLRNRHMRENYLETDKFPFTFFTGKIIENTVNQNNISVIVEGEIFIHGVRQKLQILGEIFDFKDGYKVTTSFEIKLSDFNIDIPKVMFLKLNEVIKLELLFFMKEIKYDQ